MFRIQGIERRGDGKYCAPFFQKKKDVRWVRLAVFFPRFVGTPEGKGVGVFPGVRAAAGTSTLALFHLISCIERANGQTSARYT